MTEAEGFSFGIECQSGAARAGCLRARGVRVLTPAFMPVGTQATVKAVSSQELVELGVEILISNTYHLWLRPGSELIAELGGLHRYMRWPGLIATDSGGYQAFSLAERTKLSDDGFTFSSHLDGTKLVLTPEEAMRIQAELGSDIAMQLDVCPPAGVARDEIVRAVELTTCWAERCLAAKRGNQALFAIVQGGTHADLRRNHAERLARLGVDGLALGGFSVGEPPEAMYRTLREVMPSIDSERPRYLMGVGTPRDLIIAIGLGVDLFDCVLPTRNARNGQVFVDPGPAELADSTRGPRLVIKNSTYQADSRPIQPGCACPTCSAGYSRAYLRHLYMAREILAHRLLTLHNLHFYMRLIRDARAAVVSDTYGQWAPRRLADLGYGWS